LDTEQYGERRINEQLCCEWWHGLEQRMCYAHSRAERGRLRHITFLRECASSRSVFAFRERTFTL
ncbi:MAG: hypothetical protein II273_08670, partial [Lachnospiraceae bacterium]|nr:hypothetical protein [Lachnospiraceae bacterium]